MTEAIGRASADLHAHRCPLWLRAETFRATSLFYRGSFANALRAIDTVVAGAGDRYRSILMQALWSRGLSQLALGQQYESLESYRAAIRWSDDIGEWENSGFLRALTAENLHHLGRTREAFDATLRACGS